MTIRGGPEQGWESFVGKFIYHMVKWDTFFATDHGWFTIGDLKPDTARGRRPAELSRKSKVGVSQGSAYIASREATVHGPLNPKLSHKTAKPPPAGGRLMG